MTVTKLMHFERHCFHRIWVALIIGFLASLLQVHAGGEGDIPCGKPVVGRNADGHLEVFKVEADGQLRHRWQKQSDGDWSAWSDLGGDSFPGIAVAKNTEGQLEVFAVNRASNTLMVIHQTARNGLDWSDWTNLEGSIRAPVAVGQNANGLLEVLAVDFADGSAKHIWQTNGLDRWSAWASLGRASLEPGLAVAANSDGRLELFGVDAKKGTLLHCWQRRPNAPPDDWAEWTSLGGSVLPGIGIGRNISGRLEVFAVNRTNGVVDRLCQVNAAQSSGWSAWQDFGGNARAGITAAQSSDGRLEVFIVDRKDGALLHRWEALCDDSDIWSLWTPLGRQSRPYPAVVQNDDGNLEVFAASVKDGGPLNHRRQISASSDWLDWSDMNSVTFRYTTQTWQMDKGLPDNQVQAIAQTRDGYLWVGTRQGLARFDGMVFTTFNARNTPELRNSCITALCADRTGALWIGTDGGGLLRLKEGVFSSFSTTNGLAGDNLRVIYQSRDGSVWIGTATGMSCFKNGTFKNYSRKEGLLSESVNYIYEDRSRNLWIATAKGLNCLRNGGSMDSFTMPYGLPNDAVRGICQDKGGRIWIGSNNGLLWYNPLWVGSFYAYNTHYGLSDSFVSALCEDRDGNFWVGTYSGLNRFSEGRFYNQLDKEGAPFDKVNALFEDREGNMWVGSNEGLVRLAAQHFVAFTKQQGLSHNTIRSVMQDGSGSLWVGTWGGGLDELKNGKVVAYGTNSGLTHDLILSTCESHDGSLWVGEDFDGGLTRMKKDGKFTHYTWNDGLINAGLRVLHEDKRGVLWIGTSRGLNRFKDGKFTKYTRKDGLVNDAVRAICEDSAGQLWFGTEGGLSRWENGHFTNFTTLEGLSDNTINALYSDKANDLWIGTANGGLNRYRKGHFTAFTTQKGLFSDEIFEILEDDQGWLWMSCSRGIFRVHKSALEEVGEGKAARLPQISYDKNDGMESAQCNGEGKPAGWKTRDGRLWFPTNKGLVSVDPRNVTIDEFLPPVYIEQMVADQEPLLSRRLSIHDEAGLPGDSPEQVVRIPPGRGEWEFEFTALSLLAPEKNRFKYMLEGVDTGWVDAGPRRFAHYNNIYPGNYRFRVIACNKDDTWNLVGDSFAIVFRPHYWQTWWFRGLMAFAVVFAASGTALYLTRRRMQRKLRQIEQRHAVEKERGRIAKDMHDDLGSSLTHIMMVGECAQDELAKGADVSPHVGKIISSARQTVQSLDEIVWAVNPENDTLDGLVEYISHYADEVFENSPVRCRLEMPVELQPFALSAEIRHDLFLMVKEAFNNVLKHSRASHVRVELSQTGATMQLTIEDNGRGCDLKAPVAGRKGNGLGNMRKRMESLGGKFAIVTAPGQGTRLQFTLRLKPLHETS